MKHIQKKVKYDNEEKELEGLLFGDVDTDAWKQTVEEHASEEEQADELEEGEDNEVSFFFDSGPVPVVTEEEEEEESEIDYEAEDNEENTSDEEEDSDQEDVDSAWVDEDDKRLKISLIDNNRTKKLRRNEDEDVISGIEYSRRLRQQFTKIHPTPEWATLPSQKKRKSQDSSDESEGENEEDHLNEEERLDLLKSTMGILDKRSLNKTLPPQSLDIMRLKNGNRAARSKRAITTIAFHPNAQILMTGGLDKTLRLFHIDGKVNPKIQSVYFKDMPIFHAEFHPSGDQIVVSGRRRFFYIYDIQSGVIDRSPGIWGKDEKSLERFSISPCGRYIAFLGSTGVIIVVSFLTKQWFCDLKLNTSIASVDWSPDGKYLFGFSRDNEVYQFDVQQRECVKRWVDDGCTKATTIAVSKNEKYYATGSAPGIVNIYNNDVLKPGLVHPKPIKINDKLTTRIDGIVFNHDSQLMAIYSKVKKDQLKMVHLPSGTTFSNWPTQKTPLGKITDVKFSANSDYVAIANAYGHVLLYTLKHYALK